MTPLPAFSDWYRPRLGQRPFLVQGVLWLFWGFVWIPIWYLSTSSDGAFSAWYKVKLGHQLPIAQWAMWLLGGYFWIPLWYLSRPQGPALPKRSEPVWPTVTRGERIFALVVISPVAVEVNESAEVALSESTVRIQRWNYTRMFAIGWAILSLAVSSWNGPRTAGPMTVDTFLLMAGLLYVVFVALNAFKGNYWRSFIVASEVASLPINRFALLASCAAAGLLQFILAAGLVGAAIGIAVAVRQQSHA